MITFGPLRKTLLGLSLLGFLTACADAPVEECEPGVSGISEMGTVTYPGC
ncbi:hypothetical protein [Rhodovulum steppense]|nr:hypothetical protein [Rhodovulum steppense]